MFCPECGSKCKEGALFCVRCGARLDAGSPAAAPQPEPRPASARRRGVRAAVVVCVVAALVIVGAGGFLAWRLLGSPDEGGTTVTRVEGPVAIDEAAFPDEAVRAAVTLAADTNQDGTLSLEEGDAVTELAVDGASSVSGLGPYLPNIERLTLRGDALTTVSTSDLPRLSSISVEGGTVEEMDLSHNEGLTEVVAPDASIGEVKLPQTGGVTTVQVPDSTVVSGLEGAGLREEWVPVSIVEDWRTLTIERDAAGRIISMTNESEGSSDATLYTYDSAGHLSTSARTYRMMGSDPTYESLTYTCDETGRILEARHQDGSGTVYTYDEAGRVTLIAEDFLDGSAHEMSVTYDGEGRVIEARDARGNGIPTVYTYRYDGAGRLIEATSASDLGNELANTSTRSYTYDEGGHLASISVSGEGTSIYAPSATFSFDEATSTLLGTCTLGSGGSASTSYVAVHYNERGQVTGVTESNEPISAVEGDPQVTYRRYLTRVDAPALPVGYEHTLTGTTLPAAQISSLLGYLEEGPEVVDPRPACDRVTNYFF